jgi:hypothetical protein
MTAWVLRIGPLRRWGTAFRTNRPGWIQQNVPRSGSAVFG